MAKGIVINNNYNLSGGTNVIISGNQRLPVINVDDNPIFGSLTATTYHGDY